MREQLEDAVATRGTRTEASGSADDLCGMSINVYDPSPLSPYGLELAAQFGRQGAAVRWYASPRAGALPLDSITRLNVIGDGMRGTRDVAALVRRVVGPVRFAGRSLGSGVVPVVPWVRDPWDALVFYGLTLLGKRPLVVYHNPRQARAPRPCLVGRLERALLRRSVVCVHSEEMAAMAREDFAVVRVAAHPDFTVTVAAAPPRRPAQRTVAFLGDLRADKGTDVLLRVLVGTGIQFTFQTIGRSRLSTEQEGQLSDAGIRYDAVGGDAAVPTDRFLAGLAEATVLVAPYTRPTESATALLAMAVGTPMLGMARGSLRRVLNSFSQAQNEDELAAKLAAFLQEPWHTWAIAPEDQRSLASRTWTAALRSS
jgi:hypothetical protein